MFDVWQFIACNLIDYCSLYDKGMERLGCVGCPLQGAKGMERDFARWPLYRAAYVRAFDRMLEERRRTGKSTEWNTGEDVMRWWIRGDGRVSRSQMTLWEGEQDE